MAQFDRKAVRHSNCSTGGNMNCGSRVLRSVLLASIVLGAVLTQSPAVRAAWVPIPGSPLANREHPRLLITSQSLPALKAKLSSGGVWHSDFQTWIGWADRQYGSALSVGAGDRVFVAADYALVWLTYPVSGISYGHSREEYGSVARSLLMNLPTLDVQVGNNFWYGMPIAYDWIFPLLSS